MKLYVAVCNTYDNGAGERDEILGIFDDLISAKDAFDRKEGMVTKDGVHWNKDHTCFQGMHYVTEYGLNEWKGEEKEVFYHYPYGEMLKSLQSK